MLSKKQARAFFLGGTLVTFLIFIGLTVYSLSGDQDQTNEENLTAEVVRGKEIWETNNCMGCHTLLGEGGYYAPELTKVIDRYIAADIFIFKLNLTAVCLFSFTDFSSELLSFSSFLFFNFLFISYLPRNTITFLILFFALTWYRSIASTFLHEFIAFLKLLLE